MPYFELSLLALDVLVLAGCIWNLPRRPEIAYVLQALAAISLGDLTETAISAALPGSPLGHVARGTGIVLAFAALWMHFGRPTTRPGPAEP